MFKKIPLDKNPQKMKKFLGKINKDNIKALKISLFKKTILTSELKKFLGDKYSL